MNAVVDAHEESDEISADVPNYFIQTDISDGNECVIVHSIVIQVDLLVEMALEVYGKYVVYDNGRQDLYAKVMMYLYGIIVASLLWYNKLCSDLVEIFELNPITLFLPTKW